MRGSKSLPSFCVLKTYKQTAPLKNSEQKWANPHNCKFRPGKQNRIVKKLFQQKMKTFPIFDRGSIFAFFEQDGQFPIINFWIAFFSPAPLTVSPPNVWFNCSKAADH